jgi:hypothetical protein
MACVRGSPALRLLFIGLTPTPSFAPLRVRRFAYPKGERSGPPTFRIYLLLHATRLGLRQLLSPMLRLHFSPQQSIIGDSRSFRISLTIFGDVKTLDHCVPTLISKLTKSFALGECGSPCGLQYTLCTLNLLCSLAFVSSAESPTLGTP